MRVIYKPWMQRRILNEIAKAAEQDRQIDRIVLDPYEWEQLKHEVTVNMLSLNTSWDITKNVSVAQFMGVTLEVRH
jgi:hypothetical protein